MKERVKTGAILGLCLALLVSVYRCQYYGKVAETYQANYSREAEKFRVYRSETGQQIAEQTQLLLSAKEAKKAGLQHVDPVKKIASQVQVTTKTTIKGFHVSFTDPVRVVEFPGRSTDHRVNPGVRSVKVIEPIKYKGVAPDSGDIDSSSYLKLPVHFAENREWFSLSGTITKTGISFDSLEIRSQPTITLGSNKTGLGAVFSRPDKISAFTDKNPYVSVINMKSITVYSDRKFYQRKGFWYGLGALTGVIIGGYISR